MNKVPIGLSKSKLEVKINNTWEDITKFVRGKSVKVTYKARTPRGTYDTDELKFQYLVDPAKNNSKTRKNEEIGIELRKIKKYEVRLFGKPPGENASTAGDTTVFHGYFMGNQRILSTQFYNIIVFTALDIIKQLDVPLEEFGELNQTLDYIATLLVGKVNLESSFPNSMKTKVIPEAFSTGDNKNLLKFLDNFLWEFGYTLQAKYENGSSKVSAYYHRLKSSPGDTVFSGHLGKIVGDLNQNPRNSLDFQVNQIEYPLIERRFRTTPFGYQLNVDGSAEPFNRRNPEKDDGFLVYYANDKVVPIDGYWPNIDENEITDLKFNITKPEEVVDQYQFLQSQHGDLYDNLSKETKVLYSFQHQLFYHNTGWDECEQIQTPEYLDLALENEEYFATKARLVWHNIKNNSRYPRNLFTNKTEYRVNGDTQVHVSAHEPCRYLNPEYLGYANSELERLRGRRGNNDNSIQNKQDEIERIIGLIEDENEFIATTKQEILNIKDRIRAGNLSGPLLAQLQGQVRTKENEIDRAEDGIESYNAVIRNLRDEIATLNDINENVDSSIERWQNRINSPEREQQAPTERRRFNNQISVIEARIEKLRKDFRDVERLKAQALPSEQEGINGVLKNLADMIRLEQDKLAAALAGLEEWSNVETDRPTFQLFNYKQGDTKWFCSVDQAIDYAKIGNGRTVPCEDYGDSTETVTYPKIETRIVDKDCCPQLLKNIIIKANAILVIGTGYVNSGSFIDEFKIERINRRADLLTEIFLDTSPVQDLSGDRMISENGSSITIQSYNPTLRKITTRDFISDYDKAGTIVGFFTSNTKVVIKNQKANNIFYAEDARELSQSLAITNLFGESKVSYSVRTTDSHPKIGQAFNMVVPEADIENQFYYVSKYEYFPEREINLDKVTCNRIDILGTSKGGIRKNMFRESPIYSFDDTPIREVVYVAVDSQSILEKNQYPDNTWGAFEPRSVNGLIYTNEFPEVENG